MAIAFDSSASGGNGAGDRTTTLIAAAGSTLILGTFIQDANQTDSLTGMTWNAHPMTFIAKRQAAGGITNFWMYLYAIAGSDTGTHDVVTQGITTAGNSGTADAFSYTGTSLSVPTNSITNSVDNTLQSSISATINVSASTSWVFAMAEENVNGGDVWTTGASITVRQNHGSLQSGDSNATVPAGNTTYTYSNSLTALHWAIIVAEIVIPSAGGGVTNLNRGLNLLGVGQ